VQTARLTAGQIIAVLKRARRHHAAAKAENIKDAWRARHLAQSEALTAAYAATVQAIAAVLITLNEQVGRLEEQLGEHFHQHPDARYLPVPARNR